ncbi:MAG: carbamate kinase [Polyangiaceae bacterium]
MGGNSLIDPSLPPTVENQFLITAKAVAPVAQLMAKGHRLVLTHGNGPQVGFMQLRSHLARHEVHEVPLDSLVADTQGAIGYMIQRDLREQLRKLNQDTPVAALITEVMVDPNDPAIQNPTKPVGRFYSAEEAKRMQDERGWRMVEDAGRGWRRVVPSPRPLEIVQLDTIRVLAEAGVTVIACGGGGVPVIKNDDGSIIGLEGVIDKDLASALLAVQLGVKRMFITTGVQHIQRNFGTEYAKALVHTTVAELEEMVQLGEFPPGSMGPKVEAAIYFLKNGGEEVTVCTPPALMEAFEGTAGTRIRKE